MRILLINPAENHCFKRYETYPSGALILIGTMLKNRGHSVKTIHMVSDNVDLFKLKGILKSFKPKIVGITMSTFQTKSAREISDVVKDENKEIIVVGGGVHLSALKLKTFKDFPSIDIAVLGEGEKTFIEIVEGKNLRDIKGICYNGVLNEPRPRETDLSYMPLPNLDDINLNRFSGGTFVRSYPTLFVMASRGCPYKCIFCNQSIWGNRVVYREPKAIVDEVKHLYEKYGVKSIIFQDDTFNVNKKWASEILNRIIQLGLNKKIKFLLAFRVNEKLIDEELLNLAKRAGVWIIFYGVESGNQEMLNRMRKGITIREIKRAFRLTHEAGIKTMASFIFGLPGETEETVKDTVNLWNEIEPFSSGCVHAIPLPGTEFDQVVSDNGHKFESNYDEYNFGMCITRTEELDKPELIKLRRKFVRTIKKKYIRDVLMLKDFSWLSVISISPWGIIHLYYRIYYFLGSMISRKRA